MKNILIIIAHPKEDSFSFAMANKYKEVSTKKAIMLRCLISIAANINSPFLLLTMQMH